MRNLFNLIPGPDSSSSVLANGLCGKSSSPVDYSTTQRYAYITMVTDASAEKPGLLIQHVAAKDYCENTFILFIYKCIYLFTSAYIETRGPGALYRAQEYHCNLVLFFF